MSNICLIDLTFKNYDNGQMWKIQNKKVNEILKSVRTNRGGNLLDLSANSTLLIVFVRHFGCTFCRETVSTVSKLNSELDKMKFNLVFVHMSDIDFGDEFFNKYFNNGVSHISDPSRKIYRAFGLKRGSFNQIFGISTLVNGLIAGIFKGHGIGAIEGDSLQLGGYFVFSKGQILYSHPLKNASEKFNLNYLETFEL